MAESRPQTVHVKVELDAEAFQDAVQAAIDAAAQGVRVHPTEHVHPEEVRVDDVILVPVRVTAIRPPRADGDPHRPHIYARIVPGPWAVNESGRLWAHGWTVPDTAGNKLERLVRP